MTVEIFLNGSDPVFILKGYAGTGKTTLLGGICQYISHVQNREVRLMAPTGRAAKVMAEKSKLPATTIHKGIYSFHELETIEETTEDNDDALPTEGTETYRFLYKLRNDADVVNPVFIVDEASMVSDKESKGEFFEFGSGRVLKDLVQFAKAGQTNVHTQLIFVGDPAQLPPINMKFSPALDVDYWLSEYRISAHVVELQQVVRQGNKSGILDLATQLRQGIKAGRFNHFAIPDSATDLQTLTWAEFMPTYKKAPKNKVVICYKNKTAKDLSQRIRQDTFGIDALPLQKGDSIVVGMNNFRLNLTNGSFGMVHAVTDRIIERKYTIQRKSGLITGAFRWQWVELLFQGDDDVPFTVETWVLLNFLLSDHSRLSSVESQALYVDFKIRYAEELKQKRKKAGENRPLGDFTHTMEYKETLREDPFFNAVMLKYGYAVTCHKAQGNEWADVLVCFDYSKKADFNPYEDAQLEKELTNRAFYQWAYTAITRGRTRLMALNPPRFSVFSKLTWIDTLLVSEFLATQGVETHRISWTTREDVWLAELGASQRPDSVQEKLIEVQHRLQVVGIVIQSVVEKLYQEHLTIEKAGKTARIILHFGGKNQFKSCQISGGDKLLGKAVEKILKQPIMVIIERETISTRVDSVVNYEPDVTQSQLAILFERASQFAQDKQIRLVSVKPMPYRERYSFKRAGDEVSLDFVYDGQGFFTSTQPVANQCRGQQLLSDLQQLVPFLKH